jgi:hypothetical protein
MEKTNNRELITNAFRRNPKLFIDLISKYFSLKENVLITCENILNWYLIQNNENILSKITLFKFKEQFDLNFKLELYIEKFGSIEAIRKLDIEESNDWNDIWINLSSSKKIEWSQELIKELENKWNWKILSSNTNIKWSINLIEEFKNKVDWEILSGYKKNREYYLTNNYVIKQSFSLEILENFEDYWNWRTLSCYGDYYNLMKIDKFNDYLSPFKPILWTEDLIKRFEKKIDWYLLSRNPNIIWSEELIEKHLNKWDWGGLCENTSFPWTRSLIYKYYNFVEKKFNWTIENWDDLGHEGIPKRFLNESWWLISYNKSIMWETKFIEEFKEILNIKNVLSKRNDLPWSETYIEQFKDKWDWDSLSELNLNWSKKLIEKYLNNWNWKNLSRNPYINWSESLIENHEDKWDWSELSNNYNIYWTDYLLNKYENNLNWESISYNQNLPWTEDIISKYKNKWNWEALSYNKSVFFKLSDFLEHIENLNCSENIWKTLKPYIDDEMVIELLEEIKTGKIKI